MAKSPKAGDKKRELNLRFRVTENEKLRIQFIAKENGYKDVSPYLRQIALNSNHTQLPDRQVLLNLHAELGKIGSNTNQIAKAINIRMLNGERLNFSQQLLDSAFASIDKLTQQLFRILKDGGFRKSKG